VRRHRLGTINDPAILLVLVPVNLFRRYGTSTPQGIISF
jgi:hypothetical protein